MSDSNNPSPKARKSGRGCCGIIAVLFFAAVIFSTIRYQIDKGHYTKAQQAYQQADCQTAIKSYDSILEAFRLADFGIHYEALAQQERTECEAFLEAVDKESSGEPDAAILLYSDFIFNYAASPIAKEASHRVESVFKQNEVAALASEALCGQLETLEQENLIPEKDARMPDLLHQCGQAYEEVQNFAGAVQMYDTFLSNYRSHSLASTVEDALARAIVADARASGAGTIPAPARSGSTSGSATVVTVQNDSPEQLRLVFSGPDSRIAQLAPCSSCTSYSDDAPDYCPEKGPIGRYTLPPGQYDVVVQSVSDTGVTPWTGNWDLTGGDEYFSCFLLTVTSSP